MAEAAHNRTQTIKPCSVSLKRLKLDEINAACGYAESTCSSSSLDSQVSATAEIAQTLNVANSKTSSSSSNNLPFSDDATMSTTAPISLSDSGMCAAHVAAQAAESTIQPTPTTQRNCPSLHRYETDIVHDEIVKDLPTILSLPPFDPYAPAAPQSDIVFKPVVSLMQLSLREDNVIEVSFSKKLLSEYSKRSKRDGDDEAFDAEENITRTLTELDADISMKLLCEFSKNVIRTPEGQLRPITDLADIFVKHERNEFYTFCSCKDCLEYRETIMNIMMDQFKAAHMVVMLLDVLIKAYSPMLKNDSAFNKFEKLLESNKEIYWITSGYLYDKNADYLDFIDDSTISDNMILVLFSSILMVNNPMLLLQILAYNVQCIVTAFSEGILEISQPRNAIQRSEKVLTYILDGYSELNCISQKISLNLFAFENDFLRRFKLTWVLLCQRLFQQHVYSHLADTLLSCIINLKEEALTPQNSSLIKRYILFDEHMNSIERRWSDIWVELNKFNTSGVEHLRRMGLLNVHNIFDTVVMDATAFILPDISDDEFTDFQRIEDRHLAWRNIMAFTKLKWPDGFYDPPNTRVFDDRCNKCNVVLEYHLDNCQCVTCSIAGSPTAPIGAGSVGTCSKCAAHDLVERYPKLKKSKILSTCTSDDSTAASTSSSSSSTSSSSLAKVTAARKSIALEDFYEEQSNVLIKRNESDTTLRTTYHIAWAAFQHLTTRKRYRHESLEPQNFCNENCRVSACLLARKILNNEIAPKWTQLLVRYFQPLSFSREELRATLPSIMFFNRKMHPCNVELHEQKAHNYILKTYWTFILSIYANFFMKFNFPSVTDFSNLEIVNKDLRIRLKSIVGDKSDRNFERFLGHAKRLSPFRSTDDLALLDAHIDQMQKSLDKLMSLHESQIIKHPRTETALKPKVNESPATTATSTTTTAADGSTKKSCKEKMKKCCMEYSDIGEHCKENHAKKRVKKECNHVRYNETRDRLRKKFARKKNTDVDVKVSATETVSKTTTPTPNASAPDTSVTKEPPSLKSVASAAAAFRATNDKFKTASENSLSCLDSLCKRIQLGKPINCTKEFKEAAAAKVSTAQLEAARAQIRAKEKDIEKMVASLHLTNSIGVVNEFYEFLDNYTKEQDERWINETLNFIEGTNKAQQPQTKNPKKAAKKAKQKMRKEEEKRIGELQDLRGQFHDIYFKEFTAKQELKTHVATSKKRDKKRISELEANIKKLQRAKANVETGILELIATVKQTNSDFRFTYLPTKEQQQQRMRHLAEEEASGGTQLCSNTAAAATEFSTKKLNAKTVTSASDTVLVGATNTAPATTLNLPQFLEIRNNNVFFPAMGMQTPMCYAPSPQQKLPPDVVAAMAANAVTADPSKRIVTIRRVNMPNANEPQVTVTAKGRSPDEDKLLYTFVNGQLMPTQTLQPSIDLSNYKNLRLPSLKKPQATNEQVQNPRTEDDGMTATTMLQQKLAKLNLNSNLAEKQQAPTTTTSSIKKSKKQKLKAKAASVVDSTTSSTTTCSNSTSKSETPLSSAVNTRENSVCSLKPTVNSFKSKQAASMTKNKENKQPTQQKQPTKTQKISNSKKNDIKQTNNETKIQQTKAKIQPHIATPTPTPIVETKDDKVPVKEKREKRPKLYDSGLFDNNPFRTLQDTSDSEWESGSESITEVLPTKKSINPIPEKIIKTTVIERKETTKNKTLTNKKDSKEAAATVETIATPVAVKKSKNDTNNSRLQQSTVQQQQQQQQQPQQQAKVVSNSKTKAQPILKQSQQAQMTTKQQPMNNRQRTESGSKQQSQQQQPQQSTATQPTMANTKNNQKQRTRNNSNRTQTSQPQITQNTASHVAAELPSASSTTMSKRAQQRSKRYQKQKKEDCLSGIPNNMGYFNPNDVAIPPAPQQLHQQQQQQQQHSAYGATNICQQMQNLRLTNSNNPIQSQTYTSSKQLTSNVSIMDQLNRGVQVEDLSLPPGITLTKVDPIKSEMLRQKSETIRKLAKPLQAAQTQSAATTPSVVTTATRLPMSNYFGSAYNAGVGGLDPSGIIMVEANPKSQQQQQQQHQSNVMTAAATASGKSNSRRRRRNKTKAGNNSTNCSSMPHDNVTESNIIGGATNGATKMVTLRNPMFHANIGGGPGTIGASGGHTSGIGGVGATVITQQQQQATTMLPGRSFGGGLPSAASLPMDQPAAIIKNDNGMFTIRNPVLHQAVTNGLTLGGYRQFGNVNYYTPQEAVAEVARTSQQQQQQQQLQQQQQQQHELSSSKKPANCSGNPTSFSYFSSGIANAHSQPNSTHNNISISCTNVNVNPGNNNSNNIAASAALHSGSRLTGDAAIIARPTKHTPKCISAIGSEIKQKTKEQWSTFGQEYGAADFGNAAGLQEKYQQSSYYNGFDVFPTTTSSVKPVGTGAGSLFDAADCHMHHSCGDDSPPPTITGFNSYLEGIPNTGVIRYDDASFLKNLIPGQQLNNEVSIHNVSEANFGRNSSSPAQHHVEMTPVYKPINSYEQQTSPTSSTNANPGANFCDTIPTEYTNDAQLFSQSNRLGGGMTELDVRERYNYDFDPPTTSSSTSATNDSQPTQQQGIIDLNEFLRRSPHSQRTSPYNIDENVALDNFVQNMNALQIAAAATDAEQCSHINGSNNSVSGVGGTTTGGSEPASATTVNGVWW